MQNKKLIFPILLLSYATISIASSPERTVHALTTNEDLTQFLAKHPKAIVNFTGTCNHCAPARAIVQDVANNEKGTLAFAEMPVVEQKSDGTTTQKNDIIGAYSITQRPSVLSFYNGQELKRTEKEAINQETVTDLVALLKTMKKSSS